MSGNWRLVCCFKDYSIDERSIVAIIGFKARKSIEFAQKSRTVYWRIGETAFLVIHTGGMFLAEVPNLGI